MKPSVTIAAVLAMSLLTLSGCFDSSKKTDPAQPKAITTADIAVGMDSTAFASLFPGAIIPPNGQWTRPDEIHGLRGEWTYSFYHHRLSWFVFNSYDSILSPTTFRQYLAATRLAIQDYTNRYGSPSQLMTGVLVFENPNHGYPGYPVLQASWNSGTENLRIEYSVLGGAREEPQLLFTIEVRR